MQNTSRDMAIRRITEMSVDQVSKVLVFMAGMEAEHMILEKDSKSLNESLGSGNNLNEFSKFIHVSSN